MKPQVDFKSILIGFLGAALLITAFSFKDEGPSQAGRYQTSVAEGCIIILDTQNGDYILDYYLDNRDWRKGNFSEAHLKGKGPQ
jgi:hypothetical protein